MPENFAWSDNKEGNGSGPKFESPWGNGKDRGDGPRPQPQLDEERQRRPPEVLPERRREGPPNNPFPELEIRGQDPPESNPRNNFNWNIGVPDREKPRMHTLSARDYVFMGAASGGMTEVVKQVKPYFEVPVPKSALGSTATLGTLERSAFAERATLQEAMILGEKGYGTRIAAQAGKGALLAGGALVTGLVLDSLLGNDANPTSPTRLLLDGLVLPGILVSSLSARDKVIYGSAVFCATRAAEYLWANKTSGSLDTLPDRTSEDAKKNQSTLNFSSLLIPNECDALLLPAVVLGLPGKYKLAGAAGAYVAGRTFNAIRYHNNPSYEGYLVKPVTRQGR